jgi:hypothetical protein
VGMFCYKCIINIFGQVHSQKIGACSCANNCMQ